MKSKNTGRLLPSQVIRRSKRDLYVIFACFLLVLLGEHVDSEFLMGFGAGGTWCVLALWFIHAD